MSHRGEASMKHDRKVCDFCPIITPLDYTYTTYQGTFLKQLLKKTFKSKKENPNMEEKLC